MIHFGMIKTIGLILLVRLFQRIQFRANLIIDWGIVKNDYMD